MLGLMMDKLIERKQRESNAIKGTPDVEMPEEQFFKQVGIKHKKVKYAH